ncbi:MAG: CCA tRNA nucleotidyltransferase, partial [Actinomycetota bacterium]
MTAPEIAARLRELVRLPPEALDLARLFAKRGFEFYVVGGSVRDAILGRLGADLDFATSAKPDEILDVVRSFADATWLTGIEFGTVGVAKHGHRLEITTFRGERYREDSRKPQIEPVATIEADLA